MAKDQISTPFVLGFLKPKIYIPFNVDQDELDYIISHEKSHIKHFDNLTKTVAYIILIINWYNPLMWVAYKQFSNDLELYCDETVVKNMKKEERNKYIKTLLNNTVVTNDVFVETLFFGELDIKKRAKNILKYKKANVFSVLIMIVIFIAVAFGFFTNPVPEPKQSYLDNFAVLYYLILSLFNF